jgi:hypothetical protein
MRKFEFIIVLLSFAITLFFSFVIAFAGSFIHGTFWGWFGVSFALQVIGFICWNSYLIQRDNAINQQNDIEELRAMSNISIRLTCAYCSQANEVPIRLNRKNTFKCDSCNQVNGVFMQFTATTVTTPIESVKLPISETDSTNFYVNR